MEDIRQRVQERFSQLTQVQQDVINSILANYEEYIFLSVNETARSFDVHKSTLVRLAQGLGYKGYVDFRQHLQELYRQEVSPGEKLGKTLAEVSDNELFQQVVDTEILYLRESLKTIRAEDIQQAAGLIANARRVFICGRGPQEAVVHLFEFRLRRFHFDVHTITEEGRGIFEKLQVLTDEDVLILYDFIVVPQSHRIALSVAKATETPVILITDTIAKEMADGVAVILTARRGPATIYHTNIVPLAIQNTIILQIAKRDPPRYLSCLDHLQDLRQQFGFEYTLLHRGQHQ